jgi:hypothetical protein
MQHLPYISYNFLQALPTASQRFLLAKTNGAFLIAGITTDSATLVSTPIIQYYSQTQSIAKKELQLERNKALPGFTLGYMNQGLKNTETPLRLRAGINIPIWFWQYSAAIKAAKTNLQITQQNTLGQQQNLNSKLLQAKSDAIKFQTSLAYYENTGLKQADELISASGRMFSVGQTDYITYLRTLSDAYNIQMKYLETLRAFNQSIINIKLLKRSIMKSILSFRITAILLLLIANCHLLFADGGTTTRTVMKLTNVSEVQKYFSSEAVSDKYELLLRYEPIHIGEPVHTSLCL